MAIFHVATLTPSKAELIADWIPTQPWGPGGGDSIEQIGSFHFDDPEGRVGMETHLVQANGTVYMVPLTYRDAPLDDAEHALIGHMEHSALGTRWVYDGLRDGRYLMLLAGVALTGQGIALGMAQHDGRWYAAPSTLSVVGGGGNAAPVAIDRFVVEDPRGADVVAVSDHFEMKIHRKPTTAPHPSIGLRASWAGRSSDVVLLHLERVTRSAAL